MKMEKEIQVENENLGPRIIHEEFEKAISELKLGRQPEWITYQESYKKL